MSNTSNNESINREPTVIHDSLGATLASADLLPDDVLPVDVTVWPFVDVPYETRYATSPEVDRFGNFTQVPYRVYDRDWMEKHAPDMASMIPDDPGFEDADGRFEFKFANAALAGVNLMLHGQPGCGKTLAIWYAGYLSQRPTVVIQLGEAAEIESMLGKWSLRGGETVFINGDIARGVGFPALIGLDEITGSTPAQTFELRPFGDGRSTWSHSRWDGRVQRIHPDFRMIGTGNPAWDVRNVGTAPLPEADLDRFRHMWIDYPTADVEFTIVHKRLTKWADSNGVTLTVTPREVVQALNLFRVLRADKGFTVARGTRSLLSFLMALNAQTAAEALRDVYSVGRTEPREWKAVTAALEITCWGNDAAGTTPPSDITSVLSKDQQALVKKNKWEA